MRSAFPMTVFLVLLLTSLVMGDDSGKALKFKMKSLDGKEISLEKKYAGKVVMFVKSHELRNS